MPDPSRRPPGKKPPQGPPPAADELEQLFADAIAATEDRARKPPKGGRAAPPPQDDEASLRIDVEDTLGLGNGESIFDDLDRELEDALKGEQEGDDSDLDAEMERLLTASLTRDAQDKGLKSVAPEIGDEEILALGDDGAIPLSAAKDMEIERLRVQVAELSRSLSMTELELRTAEDRVQTLEAQVVAATRSQANVTREFEAYRRRMEREREDLHKHAGEKIIKEFLGVFDNLERAMHHAGRDRSSALGQGIDMTLGQLGVSLRRHGVERIEVPPGTPFDPNVHEAMGQDFSDVPAGQVAREMQAGFALNGRLLRAAVVLVSRGPRPGSNPATPPPDAEDRATDHHPAVGSPSVVSEAEG